MIRKTFFLLVIVVLGAAIMAPMIMLLDLEPQMLDFTIRLNERPVRIPATWSLCASAGLGLLYWIVKR
jgi:hypothetical protein